VRVKRRWLSRQVELQAPGGRGRARPTRIGVQGAGVGQVERPLRVNAAWAELRGGQEHLSGEEVPEAWWTRVHVRDQTVLGAVDASHARLGLALATAVLGLLARDQAWGVRVDERRWRRRGEQRWEQAVPAGAGIRIARGTAAAPADGLEAHVYRCLSDEPRSLAAIIADLAARQPDAIPHGLLQQAADPDPRARQAWETFIEEEPRVSARIVQETVFGG